VHRYFWNSPDVSSLSEHCSAGGTGMRQYRAYLMENGHVWTAIDLSCADDDDAKRQTANLPSGHDVELWQGDRKVALLRSKERFDFH